MPLSPLGSRRFVGRTGELAALHERRRELARRHGSVVLVGGPAGIGKSRLLGEFSRTIGGGRAPLLLRAECSEYGEFAFEPIRSILGSLPGEATDVEATAGDAPERGAFFRSIERILKQAAAKRSLIITIEDIHWADPATLDFLAYLAPHIGGQRILIVLTYRDDEIALAPVAASALARIARAPAVLRLALRPLEDAEMLELVDATLAPTAKPPARILRNVIGRAEGNPFYAEELLKDILDGGPPDGLPRSIEALVLERFATLQPDEQTVLQYAAVLGYRFEPELLRAILPSSADTLADSLRHARDRNLIVEEAHEARLRFRFRHALTHEAILNRMLALEARPVHVRVARLLESLPDVSRGIGEIAYHWWKAMEPEPAVATNEAAGDAAMSVHAYGSAGMFYERALSFATDRDTQSRLCSRAAMAAAVQGDQPSAITFFERALAFEIEARRFASAGEIVRRIAGRLVYDGREREGRARLDAFMAAYGSELAEIDALLIEGWPILIDLGGGGARAWLERLSSSAAAANATGRDAWSLLLLEVNAQAAIGNIAASHAALERLQSITTEGNAIDHVFALLAGAITTAYDGADGALARERIDDTFAFCERHGLESFRKYVCAGDAIDRYLHGDLRGAQSAARKALVDMDDANQRTNMAVIGPLIGLELEDEELIALASDPDLLAALERPDCPNSTALAAGGVASRLLTLGRADEATRVLERAVEALETLFGAQVMLPLAARHVSTGRARECITALVDTVRDDDRSGQATRALVLAIFAARDRSSDRAELAREAVERYAELGWPLLQAEALELAGDVAGARELYMRCGSVRQVRRLTRGADVVPGRAEAIPALPALSTREREVAAAVAAGLSNIEIAGHLSLSVKTVESHLSRIYARLGLRSRAQLASFVTSDARREA